MKEEKLFSIGEMSKIHHVSIKTLRYYDRIDLFKPDYVNESNGYRYYSYKQFEKLNTIRFLKYLGVSLEEIKGYLDVRGKKEYLDLLKQEKRIILDKLETFQQMAEGIDHQIKEVSETINDESVDTIEVKTFEKRQVIYQEADINDVADLEIAIHELKSEVMSGKPVIIGLVGVSISKDKMIKKDYTGYDSVFIHCTEEVSLNVDKSFLKTLDAGKYVCINYVGNDHSLSAEYYQMLMDYIKSNHLTIAGDSIERVIINEYKTHNTSEYLTEIQIPIK